jgi:hypothetical protein
MHVSIPMLSKCTCYAAHAQKPHFKFKSQGLSKTKKIKFRIEELIRSVIDMELVEHRT